MNPLSILLQAMPAVALVGTYLLILAYDRMHLVERVKAKGIETEGTVVEIRRNPGGLFSSTEGEGDAPVVDFVTNWGTHKHYSTNYAIPCPFKVGEKVKVWYYFNKSRQEVVLEEAETDTLPHTLRTWGIILCLLSYPFVVKKLMLLFNF